jgi:hypothetical protein
MIWWPGLIGCGFTITLVLALLYWDSKAERRNLDDDIEDRLCLYLTIL